MKKMMSILAVAAIFASCEKKENGFEINGTTVGMEDSTAVYILKVDDTGMPVKTDTTYVIKNAFSFNGAKVEEPRMQYLQFGGDEQQMTLPFILENGTINVTFDKDHREDYKVSGTKNNDSFNSINDELKPIVKKIEEFQKNNQQKMMEARQNGDQEAMEKIMADMEAIQNEIPGKIKAFIENNKDSYISILYLASIAPQLEEEEVKRLYDNLSDDVKNTKEGKEMQEEFKALEAVSVGKKAPDFSAKSPDGTETSLYKNLGEKVTVVDFWASWCGPCRQENPNVVKLYNTYKDKGLKIVGVSLDRNLDKWKEAIKSDGLVWTQVSDLAHGNDDVIAKQYNVKSIPSIFILDKDGVIVAKNLRGAELEAKVAELVK